MNLKGSYIYIPIQPIEGCKNPLANNYDSSAQVDDGSCTFTAANISAIVNDASHSHGALVKQAFDDNYTPDNAVIYNQTDEHLMEFGAAIGIKALIHSYTGLFSHIPLAEQYYPTVPFFMPLGDNRFIELANPSTLSVIVSCGAGDADDVQNNTGYGNGLEFWDNEIYGNVVDESSFSTPIIAAKILTIMEARNCTFWQARYAARFTAIRTEPNRPANTIWHALNGFGRIDVAAAIAFNGLIPRDPFIFTGDNIYTPYTN